MSFFKNEILLISLTVLKKHKCNTISGGLSFGICFAIFFSCSFLLSFFNLTPYFNIQIPAEGFGSLESFPYVSFFWLMFLSLVLLMICLIDDLISLPVWVRLFAQVSCTILMIQLGDMNLINLGAIFGGVILFFPIILHFFTIFCVVGIANAFSWRTVLTVFFISSYIGLSRINHY